MILKKDLNQRNNVVPWGIVIGLSFFVSMVFLISVIDFEILRNKNLVKDWHLRLVLFFLAFITAINITNRVIKLMAERLNDNYLQRFHFSPEYQTFLEARWRFYFKEQKYPHAVLLLHGFAGATQEFQFLIPNLEAADIPHLAPAILGFGNSKTVILSKATRTDWYRLCLAHFDYLATIAEKVSIVGHSMGGILATYVAERRNVHQLILCSPGIFCAKTDLKYRSMLMNPILSYFYIKIIPYIPKTIRPGRETCSDTLDNKHARNIFQYLAIPIKSLRELFHAQEEVNPHKINCAHLTIIHGQHELTVDVTRLFDILDKHAIPYRSHCFMNSAHNVLEDFDREESCQLVADILASRINSSSR